MVKKTNLDLRQAAPFAGLTVVLGAVVLWATLAAGTPVAFEAETGTVTAPASKVSVTGASGGQVVKFGAGTPTPTSPPTGGCTLKPSATNVGAVQGPLTTRSGDIRVTSGQTLANVKTTGGIDIIDANKVTIRNVHASQGMLIQNSTNVTVEYFTANDGGMSVSSSQTVTIKYANLSPSADGFHVTSDAGSMNTDIGISYSYVHDPHVEPDAHYDGIQVRGVNRLNFSCNNIDSGPYQDMWNANVYLEDANGGNSNVTVDKNWLYGGAFSVMLDYGTNNKLLNNRIDGDIHWDYCYVDENSAPNGFVSTGNVDDSSGAPINLCL